jgi:outer membrane scaffolding protein for murein synthesis (MipA/OmpV family)
MTSTRPLLTTLALAAGLAGACPAALSQSFDAVRLSAAAAGQSGGTAGLAVFEGHEYLGSDQRRTRVLPVVDYQWADGWFAGVTNGIGYNFSGSAQMQYGLRLTADAGRKASRASALHGMGDVEPAAEGGVFFNYALPQGLLLTSSARYGSGDGRKGVVVDLGAFYGTALAPKWRVGAGTAITLANADAMQSYFGVTGGQSATSGYAVYTAGPGARDARVNAVLTYAFDPRTSVTAMVGASRLLGDAKDSPLTRERTSGSGVVAVTCAF